MKKRHTYHQPSAEPAAPVDTGACSVSHSIAATLPAAMLRPLPQAPVGGKKHASLDPPRDALSFCVRLWNVMLWPVQAMTYPCLSKTKDHPEGCSFVLRSASCYVRVGYSYKNVREKNK